MQVPRSARRMQSGQIWRQMICVRQPLDRLANDLFLSMPSQLYIKQYVTVNSRPHEPPAWANLTSNNKKWNLHYGRRSLPGKKYFIGQSTAVPQILLTELKSPLQEQLSVCRLKSVKQLRGFSLMHARLSQ